MGLVSKLSVKPLLWVVGLQLCGLLALGAWSWALKAEAGAERARAGQAAAQRDTAATERDAWKSAAAGLSASQAATLTAFDDLKGELERRQTEAERQRHANEQAIAAARAEARDADRTLQAFAARFQVESRKPDCAHALGALEAACPALRDY